MSRIPYRLVGTIGLVNGSDLGAGFYKTIFQGGKYAGGTNVIPATHRTAGITARDLIEPLDAAGAPDAGGKIGWVALGMSNWTKEMCVIHEGGEPGGRPCTSESFIGKALVDTTINPALVFVNGARDGQSNEKWDNPTGAEYDRVEDLLPLYGLTEEQIQIVWMKAVLKEQSLRPTLPHPDADAYEELRVLGDCVRAAKVRYPNLRQLWVSNRIYGGYSRPGGNSPEPWAYETFWAVKWLIGGQITQRDTAVVDPDAGDLLTGASWLGWGPDLWAPGSEPRADGLIWNRQDFVDDGLHAEVGAGLGVDKASSMIMTHHKTSEMIAPYFTTSAFDPASLPALFLRTQKNVGNWTDAAGTIAAGVGDLVERRDDVSGNGRHFIATGTQRPTRRAGWIEFDGITNVMIATMSGLTFPFSLHLIGRGILGRGGLTVRSGDTRYFSAGFADTAPRIAARNAASGEQEIIGSPSASKQVITCIFEAMDKRHLYVNGVFVGTSTVAVNIFAQTSARLFSVTSALFLQGVEIESIIQDTATSPTNISNIAAYGSTL